MKGSLHFVFRDKAHQYIAAQCLNHYTWVAYCIWLRRKTYEIVLQTDAVEIPLGIENIYTLSFLLVIVD